MSVLLVRLMAGGLIVVGLLKAWMHAQAASTLTLPGCFGSDFTVQLDAPLLAVHCWGCYVAAFGAVMLLASFRWSFGLAGLATVMGGPSRR